MTFSNANNATYNLQAQYRGATYVKADVATWIKKQWAKMVRRELDQKLLLRQFVMMFNFPDGKYGDQITIPTIGRLGVNRKIAGVPVTLQKGQTNSYNVLIDQYAETSFMTEDIVSIMLDPSGLLANNLAKEAAYAIRRDMDAFLLGLRAAVMGLANSQVIYSSSDGLNGTGSTSQPLTLNTLLRAKLVLDNLDVEDDRVWIVSPTQYNQLLALDKVQSMFYRTSAPLENGIVGTLLGSPVYMTSMIGANSTTGFVNAGANIPTPGVTGAGQIYYPSQDTAVSLPTTWNTTANPSNTLGQQTVHTALYMQREAFGLAMLMEPKTEHSRETLYLADAVVTSTLYGAKMYRTTNAVIVHTNAVLPAV